MKTQKKTFNIILMGTILTFAILGANTAVASCDQPGCKNCVSECNNMKECEKACAKTYNCKAGCNI